jgi:hypothetical protein
MVLGYHGCDATTAEHLLGGGAFVESKNDYDWLGHGIYFWEFGEHRAWRFAQEQQARARVQQPAVVGVLLQLGRCFDLLDTRFTEDLLEGYQAYKQKQKAPNKLLPKNKGKTPDKKLRFRDCDVINWYLQAQEESGSPSYDTIRGCFWEGGPAFPQSKLSKEAHIQIAVRNPACILGVFRP